MPRKTHRGNETELVSRVWRGFHPHARSGTWRWSFRKAVVAHEGLSGVTCEPEPQPAGPVGPDGRGSGYEVSDVGRGRSSSLG